MLTTASCMFPLHQGTLLRHWMVYSRVWPLCSHGCRRLNWSWTQIKLNFPLLGKNDRGANTPLCFLLSFSVSKLTLSPSAHIYQQSVAHAFAICGICSIFAVTLIWIVQNYLQLLLCPAVSIITIRFCMVSPILTLQVYSMFRIDWPTLWQSLLHLLAVFHCFVAFIGCQ